MIQNHFTNKAFRYTLLAFVGGLLSLSADAQGRRFGEGNRAGSENREPRVQNNSPQRPQGPGNNQQRWGQNSNREPRPQAPVANGQSNRWGQQRNMERRQSPVANNQFNNRWRRDDNRQQNQRPPMASNDNRNRRPNSFPSNNNRYDNRRNYPVRASRYDNFRHSPGYRHPIYSSRNPGWRYSYLPRRNSIITSFSLPFITLNFGGYGYRYCDGVYYRPYNNVYRVVAPPIGIYINTLPYGYRRIYVNDNPYYYYNGTYYDDYQDSYRVVAPPVGAIVESIPEGYETVTIDGETYYTVDDVQYKPVVQENGEIWYEVIKVG